MDQLPRCPARVVASFLPYDIVCVRETHLVGAHIDTHGKPWLYTTEPKKTLAGKKRKVVRRR